MGTIDGIGSGINVTVQGSRDARLAAANARSTINDTAEAVNNLRKKVGDTRQLSKIAATTNLTRGFGVAGVASAVAGFAIAAKKGDINGMIGALGDLGQNMAGVLKTLDKVPGGKEFLTKFGGVAGIVGGITGAINTLKDMKKSGINAGNVMKLASNVLSTVAGAAVFIPGGQVVAAAAAAASAGLSLGALAYKYKGEIANAGKAAVNAVADTASNAASAVTGGAKRAWNSIFGG